MRTYSFGCGSLLRYTGFDHMCIVISGTSAINGFLVMRLNIKTGKLYYHYSDQYATAIILKY